MSYGSEAYKKRRAAGICGICAVNPVIKKILPDGTEKLLTYCQSCKEKAYNRRKMAREKSLCTTCLIRPRVFGKRKCSSCLERDKLAARTRRKEADKKNLCKRCNTNPKADWSKTFCDECVEKHNETNRKKAKILKSEKVCKSCGKKPVVGGEKDGRRVGWGKSNIYCKDCLEKIRSRRRAKIPLKKNLVNGKAWSKIRKKKGSNENPLIIGAREEKKEFVDAFGIFNKGKII